jgi:hypothetical protein
MYKKIFASVSSLAIALVAFGAQAAAYTIEPGVYDPDNTGTAVAYITPEGDLRLEKNAPTPTNSAAGANIAGVEGLSTTGLTLSFDVDGYCGAGAPRFNVYLENGDVVFLGCIHGDADADGHVSFTAGNTYGGVLFPEGETVSMIQIIQDEEGQTTLSNIMVNGMEAVADPQAAKDQCKNGGWESLGYKNQGQCVSAYAKMQQ